MTTLLFTHNDFHRHEVPPGHAEHAGRYDAVDAALSTQDFADLARRSAPMAADRDLMLVHPERYVEAVRKNAPATGLAQFDADTFLGPSSLNASLRGAGACIAAVDALFDDAADNAFIAARPPGHHAEPERAMGFCFFNNVAIAGLHARRRGASKIAILDFDVHHGNGTEVACWHDEGAFFASSHEWPQYPGTGRETDRGAFDNIHNAPLPTGADGQTFRRVWGDRLLPALSDFDPDLIVISAGFDAHKADPLGGLELTEDDFAWLTKEIVGVAKSACEGRIVSVLEGGYDLSALGASAAAHVKVLMQG